MAIRIENKTPQLGRLTLPRGTYLSNPSTAADGGLGLGGAELPPTPQVNMWGSVTPGYNATPMLGAQLANAGSRGRGPGVPGTVHPYLGLNWSTVGQNVTNFLRSELGMDMSLYPAYTPKSPFVTRTWIAGEPPTEPQPRSAFQNNPSAQNVAYQTGLPAGTVPAYQVNQLGATDGLTPEQIRQQMVSAGYSLQYRSGVGQVWVPRTTASGAPVTGGAIDTRGRPEFVDGSTLAPGESVVTSSGDRIVGGTPAPDGTAQYAVNFANPDARDDKHGRYKWVSEVKRDANGNWVRINRQVLRKVYRRSHLKNRPGNSSTSAQSATATGRENNQLINFRVQYG